MSVAPTPSDIFRRAIEEGERRLGQSLLELVSTGFIAGFTIVFGITALGIVHAMLEPLSGAVAELAGALAFGIGLVFLVVGRAELFTENFFGPVATVVVRRKAGTAASLLRLWSVTFLLNLVGGTLFVLILSVDGALPSDTAGALEAIAQEIVDRGALAGFAKAIAGGALVTLLSYLLEAVNSVGSRIALAYLTGFLLALGPFDHVVVASLHVVFGIVLGAPIGFGALGQVLIVVTAGNLLGGLGLVTLTHITQAKGEEQAEE